MAPFSKNKTEIDERRAKGLELERKAARLQQDGKIQQAFDCYDEAGNIFRGLGEHLKASICYSAAATCWNIHTGRQSMAQAASRNFLAASEAVRSGQYDYARSLYREAALLYEREGDTEHYSRCFIESQHAGRRRAWELWTRGQSSDPFDIEAVLNQKAGFVLRVSNFFRWLLNLLNDLVWGYGEKPFRTLALLACTVVLCGLAYSSSGCIRVDGMMRTLSAWEGLYFSMITLSTVGYGDLLPTGWTQFLAACEGFAGMTLMPLFIVALTRRHLRMYR